MKKIRAILSNRYWFVITISFLLIIIIGIMFFKSFLEILAAIIIVITSISASYFLIMYLNYYDKKNDVRLIMVNSRIREVNKEIRLNNNGLKSKKEYKEYFYISPPLNDKTAGLVIIIYLLYLIFSLFFPLTAFCLMLVFQPIIILRYRTNCKKKMVFRNEPYNKKTYEQQIQQF